MATYGLYLGMVGLSPEQQRQFIHQQSTYSSVKNRTQDDEGEPLKPPSRTATRTTSTLEQQKTDVAKTNGKFCHELWICFSKGLSMDLIEFIDLKWNGLRTVSSSDDEFEIVEVLNNREEEEKKKKQRKARKRQSTDEAIENERNLNGRNKNGLSQGR